MEVRKSIFIKALIVTLAIFLSVYSLNLYLNSERERVVNDRMNEVMSEFEEFQALTNLMDVFGENVTCMTLNSRIKLLDTNIWKLGQKIEAYKQVTRNYWDDPYYQVQKQKFNRQEVIYLSILKEMKKRCGYEQVQIIFFYRKSELCSRCDDQAYVLDYLNQRMDPEIAIFSFDADLGLPSVDVLQSVYNVTEYPCLVVEDVAYCGMREKAEMEKMLCDASSTLPVCGLIENKSQ